MKLSNKAQQCQLLREKIDGLISADLYVVEELSILSEQLNTILSEPIQPEDDEEQYALFLKLNLDWLQSLMAKLTEDKDRVAASVLHLQKGIRARHSYGENN
ncbi:hypothetical protein [Rheinheimera metallidurans]|uniref:hypothetical protein n=1 Tax=Rheinheimera metallidurans TaxID=2925781 RepID=UPI003002BB41